jgi:AcrR family transcriptional regulator
MTPRTSEQFEQMRSESKSKIMAAALELFTKQGFDTTPISMISKKAGVSTGLMYNYFASKDQLLEEMIHEALEMSKKGLAEISEIDGPFVQIERFVHKTIYGMRKKQTIFMSKLIFLIQVKPNPSPEMTLLLKDYNLNAYNTLESIFEKMELENPELEARLLTAILSGFRLQYFLFKNDFQFDEMYELVMERYTDI